MDFTAVRVISSTIERLAAMMSRVAAAKGKRKVKENVISSDSIILDRCLSWINLAALCMERQNRQGLRVWDDLKEQVDE